MSGTRWRAPSADAGARAAGPRPAGDGEVVVVMGIPGAGKSRVAEDYVARGYVRLNRDERGGSLRDLADALAEQVASGVRRVVLDNTYLTRATRSHVIDAASRHGLPARCVWLDTPLAQAQVNLVERLLDRAGSLPGPAELRVLADAGAAVAACARGAAATGWLTGRRRQMRARRELEPTVGRSSGSGRAFSSGRACAIPRARRAAGADRPCPGCPSRSRAPTESSRRGPCSSASLPHTARSRRRSGPGTSRSDATTEAVGPPQTVVAGVRSEQEVGP